MIEKASDLLTVWNDATHMGTSVLCRVFIVCVCKCSSTFFFVSPNVLNGNENRDEIPLGSATLSLQGLRREIGSEIGDDHATVFARRVAARVNHRTTACRTLNRMRTRPRRKMVLFRQTTPKRRQRNSRMWIIWF